MAMRLGPGRLYGVPRASCLPCGRSHSREGGGSDDGSLMGCCTVARAQSSGRWSVDARRDDAAVGTGNDVCNVQ